MTRGFILWIPAAVASGAIACGAGSSSKKVDVDGGDGGGLDSGSPGSGGRSGTGGRASTGGAPATGGAVGSGGTVTGGTTGSGGTPIADAGPDAPIVDAAPEAAPDVDVCAPLPDDSTPPTVVAARFIEGGSVEITFSEPVQPPTGVDPLKFRLSLAWHQNNEATYDTTYYEDMGYYVFDSSTDFNALSGSSCTDKIIATLDTAVTNANICQALDNINLNGYRSDVGLRLHFNEGAAPSIQDRAGNVLGSFGALWVTGPDGGSRPDSTSTYAPTNFPGGSLPVSVDCSVPDAGADASVPPA